jgi:hypothetical protein
MERKKNPVKEPPPIRKLVERPSQPTAAVSMLLVKTHSPRECRECRVENAFHAWHDAHLTASYNYSIDFTGTVNIPASKRAVIELVTASVYVPSGEKARLRMYKSLGSTPSNLDFVLSP